MAAASALQEPLVDRNALDRHTMGNAVLQQELFMLFFDQMPLYLDQMAEALEDGDLDNWRMAAHGIKGSSRALGFVRLASLARECEISPPEREGLEHLLAAIEQTRDDVEAPTAA